MESSTRTTLWAFLLIAGILLAALYLLRHDDGSKSSTEDYVDVELLSKIATESSSLHFGPEDVVVTHGWSILSGIYPAVKFRCRLDSPLKKSGTVILCYRPKGTSRWLMADTRLRRDNTARITLRDLKHDASYECFFFLLLEDCLLRSEVVTFSTSDH